MREAALIASNFLREQRWLVVVLFVWVTGASAVAASGNAAASLEDVLFFLKQQAVYGISFATFLAASAAHTERKSRRILAVLSKGITRRQYLAGLLLGVLYVALIYCAAMAIAGALVFPRARVPQPGSWIVIVMILVTSILTSTLALVWSTLIPPLFAAGATAITLGLMSVAARLGAGAIFPFFGMMQAILEFSPTMPLRWADSLPIIGIALVQSVLFWWIAGAIFAYRDIAVAVE